MATVNGLSKERMLEIEANSIIDGEIDVPSGHLLLTQHDGTVIDAGNVVGPTGPEHPSFGSVANYGVAVRWIRVALIDGLDASNGSELEFDFYGGANISQLSKYSAKVQVAQRGADVINVNLYEDGPENLGVLWFTKQLSTYQFELWVQLPSYAGKVTIEPRNIWHATMLYDSEQTTAPGGIVSSTVQVDYPKNHKLALLETTYRGPGPAKVIDLPGTTLSAGTYPWIGKYERWGNRVVEMVRDDGAWNILGHTNRELYGGKIKLDLTANLLSYGEMTNNSTYTEPRVQRLPSGIVLLSGLIGFYLVAAYNGQVLFTLPVGHRPDTDMLFPILNTDQGRVLLVKANGSVQVYGGNWVVGSNDYVSLDGVAFPAAGVATWTAIGSGGSAFTNGWGANVAHTPNYGVPGFWKDPYGVVWFRGLISGGTMTADLAMFTLPTGYGSPKQTHQLIAAGSAVADGTGLVSTFADGGSTLGKVAWKTGTIGNVYVSLAGVKNWTADAFTINADVIRTVIFSNSWTAYGSTFTTPQFMRRGDGLAMAQGLMGVGTLNTLITVFQEVMAPERRAILCTTGSDTFRRMEMGGLPRIDNWYPGEIRANNAASAWQSLDRMVWMVGD